MRGIVSGRSWAVVSVLLAVLAAIVAWSLTGGAAPAAPVAALKPAAVVPAPSPTAPASTDSGSATVTDAEPAAGPTGLKGGGAAVPEWSSVSQSAAGGLRTNPKSEPLRVPSAGGAVSDYQAAPLQPLDSSGAAGEAPIGGGTALVGAQPTRPEIDALIRQYFPADQVDNARRISLCESGQRNATSVPNTDGTRDRGIFQINDGGTFQELARRLGSNPADLSLALNPQWNVMAAAELYHARGWQPWTCARKVQLT